MWRCTIAYWSISWTSCQVGAVVDAGELALPIRVRRAASTATTPRPSADRDLHQLRQVQLARRRARRQLLDRIAQPGGVERIQPGIDQRDLALVLARVLELDDAFDAAIRGHHDTAVARRVVELDGGERHGRAALATAVEQRAHRIRLDQRDVAVRNDDLVNIRRECLERRSQCVSRAALALC